MEYLIIFTMIYIISAILAIKLNKKIEQMVPISVVGMILTIYLCGLFNNLILGVIILVIIVSILLVYFIKLILEKIKNKQIQETLDQLITPAIVIYLILIIISIILNKGRVLEIYDSFNHWAILVKNMFINNSYGTKSTIITFNEYPPFTGTFQYLLLKLSGYYSEDTIIIAQNILYFSMILPIFKKTKWDKSSFSIIVMLPIVIFLPFIFYKTFYTEILVDGFIGIIFALSLYQVYKNENNTLYRNLILGSYLITLTLTKNIGILFAAIIIIIEIISKFINKTGKQELKKQLKIVGILTLIILIFYGMWFIKIKIEHANLNWDNPEKIYQNEQERNGIVQQFVNEIFNGSQEIATRGLSAFSCFLIYLSLSILIYKIHKDRKLLLIQLSMTVIMIFYTIFTIIPYLILFESEETMILSSFDRYISSIILSGFFLNILILFDKFEIKIHHIIYVITILALFLPFKDIQHMYVHADMYNDMVLYKREKYGYIKYFKSIFNENDKIYLVADNIFDKWYVMGLNKYEVLPAKIGNENFFEVPSNIKNELENGYTYIYIINENRHFNHRFKEEFETDINLCEKSLYQIINREGNIYFERILIRDII